MIQTLGSRLSSNAGAWPLVVETTRGQVHLRRPAGRPARAALQDGDPPSQVLWVLDRGGTHLSRCGPDWPTLSVALSSRPGSPIWSAKVRRPLRHPGYDQHRAAV